jgi:hypothetical protein
MHREIGFSTGKPKRQAKFKKLYYQLLRRGRRVCRRFERELAVVEKALAEKSLLPGLVSSDDGYSNKGAREDLLEAGVEVVSISGAKGKSITTPEQWNRPDYRAARAKRSAVESLMFTLKEGYEFGHLLRRENENVRAELMEKVLAYNIGQITRVRERRARESLAQSMAA